MPVSIPQQFGASDAKWPLLGIADPERTLAWRDGRAVSASRFLAHVHSVARALPQASHVVNLCEDRYAFLVGFCAALVNGQTNLLPPSRAPQAVADIMAAHPGSYALGDQESPASALPHVRFPDLSDSTADDVAMPHIAADHVAAIGYTSGSTGRPHANAKTWGSFVASTDGNLAMLRRHLREPFHVLATVPPQHMYGLEMSILLPLRGHVGVHAGHPLLPADVAAALDGLPTPRVLVTTPVHLRALIRSGQPMPPLDAMLSATAPLPEALAREAEATFGAPLLEVFGSTETCVFATRRSARETAWTTYPGVRVHPQPDGTRIEAPQLAEPVVLADLVEATETGFRLCGRGTDLLDMAGKRASLADLNQRLLAVDGVDDGVIFQLDDGDGLAVKRLAALVVAPSVSEADIRAALARDVDAVFLPRPLRKVAGLPRNATGKLPRAALLQMLAQATTGE
ncbi:MAG TPA: AMP-binding protein [Oleiagrimonas sp.]|nr:AMP-binding protein [Oleiagrimonas sp.]